MAEFSVTSARRSVQEAVGVPSAAGGAHGLWALPLVVGGVGGGLYLATDIGWVRSTAFLGVALMSVAAILGGNALHRPSGPIFWRLMALAATLFVVGALVRPWAVDQPGVAAATGDVFTLSGYAACVSGLLGIAGPHVRSNSFALLDGLVAAVGCAGLAVVFLVLPAVAIGSRPLWVSVLAGIYPLLDVAVVLVILQLAFTSAVKTWSFRALTVSLVLLVVGDAGYAWIGARGQLVGPPSLDLPFFGAYTFFAVAALHPTMTRLTSAVPRPAQAWSTPRLLLLVPAACLPAVGVLLSSDHSVPARVAEATASVAVCGLLVRRALSAVRRHVAAQETLVYQSTHDALTGLANRVAALTQLEALTGAAARAGGAVWATVIDLDQFRLVNDTWGSAVGDRLLANMASRIGAVAEGHGCAVVARQGGDEFVLAGTARDRDEAVTAALDLSAALRSAAAHPVSVDQLEFVVTVSMGAAVSAVPTTAVALLRNADTALGRAKTEGRDRCVVYDEAMSAVVAKRLSLGTALRRAVELEELRVAYQPIVALSTGRIHGCEALLRWTTRDQGPISPAEFIPVAEESGLVVELGAWVLHESARTLADWRRRGIVDNDFFVSVNVSARQLVDDRFVATVQDVLARTRLPARCLALEITESVMLTNPEQSIARLEDVRRIGVRLSLDDFGTGYSSLSHLDRLPVHTVKLDRSFVSPLDGPAGNAAIVRAVHGISEALGLSMVAEGVETTGQRDALRDVGIELGQGWLWGAAVSASDFESKWTLSSGNVITVAATTADPDGWRTTRP